MTRNETCPKEIRGMKLQKSEGKPAREVNTVIRGQGEAGRSLPGALHQFLVKVIISATFVFRSKLQ